jgi:hypothetical protein
MKGMNLFFGLGVEADHDAVAAARGFAVERLADPDREMMAEDRAN